MRWALRATGATICMAALTGAALASWSAEPAAHPASASASAGATEPAASSAASASASELTQQVQTQPVLPTIAPVAVQGQSTAARDAKTLSHLLKAEQIFLAEQALAPEGVLRFKVFGRKEAEASRLVNLVLLAPQGALPIALEADGRFALDEAWRALETGTELHSRLRDGKVTWRADVRTPGSTPQLRRLGDLRLQCRASFFSGMARTAGPGGLFIHLLKPLLNGCDSSRFGWSSFADAPVFGIRLKHGQRVQQISQMALGGMGHLEGLSLPLFDWSYSLRHQLYRLPLGDSAWPDDTVVEFEGIEKDDSATAVDPALLQAPGPLPEAARSLQAGELSQWDALKARLGRDRGMMRYDSGLRVVLYTQEGRAAADAGASPTPELELVLLFDAQDRLLKWSLRAMGEQRLDEAAAAPWSR